ncbi:phosphosulfolactate synthase [Paenibacillus sp. GCM10023252]|uniref:phosphosulfolactate synthase n=1 Tax=Paenibacillus sp. GCM10023252 TaxID=3252649 RepID=UPI0036093DAE
MNKPLAGPWPGKLIDPSGRRQLGCASPSQGSYGCHEYYDEASGRTMVIDKGMGLHAYQDMLELGSSYIDMIKLGFGTAVLYPTDLLRRKIELAALKGLLIMPGGTLLEAAVQQGVASSLFDSMCQLGFSGVEVSDGTIELSRRVRSDLIREGTARGLYVVSEYGKKKAGSAVNPYELAVTAEADWSAGAQYITVEARESGVDVGLFDDKGQCREELLKQIELALPNTKQLMWEAPLKQQQVYLLQHYGSGVHLGNIPPSEVLSLETMRRGLRSDTFSFGLQNEPIHYMI